MRFYLDVKHLDAHLLTLLPHTHDRYHNTVRYRLALLCPHSVSIWLGTWRLVLARSPFTMSSSASCEEYLL